jgi:hypothetical protein
MTHGINLRGKRSGHNDAKIVTTYLQPSPELIHSLWRRSLWHSGTLSAEEPTAPTALFRCSEGFG